MSHTVNSERTSRLPACFFIFFVVRFVCNFSVCIVYEMYKYYTESCVHFWTIINLKNFVTHQNYYQDYYLWLFCFICVCLTAMSCDLEAFENCFLTFPSLCSTCVDSAELKYDDDVPVVILLGWGGCQWRHLKKYHAIYEKKWVSTFVVLTVLSGISLVLNTLVYANIHMYLVMFLKY